MRRLKIFILSILPGIFLMGYNIGTGSITSMSKAGANFGLDLLWAILISCIITYYLFITFSRFTMATDKTIIQGIKDHVNPYLAMVLIVIFSIIILGALIGVLGIIAEVIQVAVHESFGYHLPLGLYAVLISVLIYTLLFIGTFGFFEKVLAFLVSIMGFTFIFTMIMTPPSLTPFFSGLVPKIPETTEGSDNTPFSIVASMIGTTVSVFAFVVRTQIVKQTGWKMSDWKLQKRDAGISAFLMFLISMAVMITAATTLHEKGLKLNNVAEMIPLMEPIAGSAAPILFVLGITAAGLSSHIPNLLMIPWLIIDYRHGKQDTRTLRNRLLLLLLVGFSALGVTFGIKPIFIMIFSQACIGIVLPTVIACLWFLTTRKKIMGGHVNKPLDNSLLLGILLFSLTMGVLGLKGVLTDIANMIG